MEISALLTSAGINIGACVLLFSLYSVLRKQPSNRGVYFARSLAQLRSKRHDPNCFDRYVPSPRWILQAWEATDDEILAAGGLDAVVFVKAVVFSIRVFSIAATICLALVLPLNYLGEDVKHKRIDSESLEVFTIQNIKEGSRWLWAHCLALCIISCSAWTLLYFEYKSIARLRLEHIRKSSTNPSLFTVVFRGIPLLSEENYSTSLTKFLTKYYSSDYLSHQMVYRCGRIVKLIRKAEKMYDMFSAQHPSSGCTPYGFCDRPPNAFDILSNVSDETEKDKPNDASQEMHMSGKESSAAFAFFKTRYAAATVALAIQTSNPMLWVTDLAPEPSDVYWPNICIPYRQFWMRKIATLVATAAFMIFFLAPVALVQSLANLQQLQKMFPFLRGMLENKVVIQVVTGYLPSVILILFFYMVPPLMLLFSTVEGYISRSGRKRATCLKVLYFTIWNVFFVNLVSGTVINKLSIIANPKAIPRQLAERAVPALVKFFMTYIMTSGWTSLACELVQLYPLLCNYIYRYVLRKKHGPFETGWTFPFHTEVPRVLLFGLLGFNFAVLAPLILPLLLIYFFLAYAVYRNQILNVYLFEYDTGGMYWPVIHSTTIFSMVLAQIMALGVFAIKESPVCMGFTILLIVLTLLFNEYCRQRFRPVFNNIASQDIIDLDQQDDANARNRIYEKLQKGYCQHEWVAYDDSKKTKGSGNATHAKRIQDSHFKPGNCKERKTQATPESYRTERPILSDVELNHQLPLSCAEGKCMDLKPISCWPRGKLMAGKQSLLPPPPPPPPSLVGYSLEGSETVPRNQPGSPVLFSVEGSRPTRRGNHSGSSSGSYDWEGVHTGEEGQQRGPPRLHAWEGEKPVEENQSGLVKDNSSGQVRKPNKL